MRLWDPTARAEVLILFPGSGNASGGQGPHEREMQSEARARAQPSPRAGPGPSSLQRWSHKKTKIHLVSNNTTPDLSKKKEKDPDTEHSSSRPSAPTSREIPVEGVNKRGGGRERSKDEELDGESYSAVDQTSDPRRFPSRRLGPSLSCVYV